MNTWQKVKIGEFLFERKGKYKPDDKSITRLKRIEKIDFSGNFHIANKPSETNMILICPRDLVISGINVAKGAMGVYYGNENMTATIHYSSYTFDTSKIDVEYFKRFLKSSEFIRLLQEQVKGGIKTEIKPKHLLPLKIELPDLAEQKQILKHFQSIETEEAELKQELTHQQTLLKKLRQQILQEAIEGKLTAEWRTVHPSAPNPSAPAGHLPLSGEEFESANKQSVALSGEEVLSSPPVKGEYRVAGRGLLNNLPHLKTFRKNLRANLTPAEAKLWTLLKGKKLKGRKFRRQHSIANYILDFYCPSENLRLNWMEKSITIRMLPNMTRRETFL